MKSIGSLKLVTAMLCDDIRKEDRTNKYILIGTYSGDIHVGAPLPQHALFAIYLEFLVPVGDHEIDLRVSGPGSGKAILKARITQEKEGAGVIASPRMDLELEREGYLRFDARVAGGKWTNVLKKRVSGPTSSPQPSEQSPPDAPETSSPPEPSPQGSPKKRRRS